MWLFVAAGYRLFKAVMFTTGLVTGSAVVFLVCRSEEALLPILASVGLAAIAGLLFGQFMSLWSCFNFSIKLFLNA